MGEIDRVGAYVVRVYSNEPEFEEPDVHVWRAGTWAKISIPTETSVARVLGISRKRMASAHVIEAVRLVEPKATTRYGKETD